MKTGYNQCYSSKFGQNVLVTGVMIPYDSDPELQEKNGKNGDAMTDFESL